MWKYKFNPLSWEFDLVGGNLDGLASLESQEEVDNDDLILVNDPDWNAKKVTVSQLIDQTIPDIYNNPTFKYNPNRRLRILTFGSSWFCCDNIYLNKILGNLWIKNEIHHYYMWHSQFNEWIMFYNHDFVTPFRWSDASRWTVVYKSIDWADWDIYYSHMTWSYSWATHISNEEYAQMWYDDIRNGKRDIVIVQQWAHQCCKPIYREHQDKFIKFIKEATSPDTVIWFNKTWTPAQSSAYLRSDAVHTVTNTVEWQHIFLQDHHDRVRDLMAKEWIYNVAPTGIVLQMMREYTDWNTASKDYCTDWLHPDNWLACFAINACLYEALIAPITGIPVKMCTWLPNASTIITPFNTSWYTEITSDKAFRIYDMIATAIAKRREIIPDEQRTATWWWIVDAYEWGTWWVSVATGPWNDALVANTLVIWPEPWYSIKSVKQNWMKITGSWYTYSVNMRQWENLFEVEFEKTSTPATTYTITPTVTDWFVVSCPTSTDANGTAVLVRANSNAVLPNSITVTGASYTWDASTWAIVLSSVTGNVSITVACVAPRAITYSTTNTYMLTAPTEVASTATIQFEPDTIAYDYPSSVTVTWATSNYDDTTWTITLSNPTSDVTVTINCPEKTVTTWSDYTVPSSLNTPLKSATITMDRFFLPFYVSSSTDLTRYRPYIKTPNYRWRGDWWTASIFIPAWHSITVHLANNTNTHQYAAVISKHAFAHVREYTTASQTEYRHSVLCINGVDTTEMLWATDTKSYTTIRPNPYYDYIQSVWTATWYFPYNTSNDFTYVNTNAFPVYVWIWVKQFAGGNMQPTDFTLTYQYTQLVTRNITTTITWWDLISNPTSMISTGTATITFAPTHLFKVYPTSVTVSWASYTYDDTTWTIVLSNPTSDVTVSITCPDNTVTENVATSIPTANLSNSVTTTVTWVRHLRFSWADPSSSRVSLTWWRYTEPAGSTYDWVYADWNLAALWIPAWKTITIHTSDTVKTTKYWVFLTNVKRVPWRISPRPSVIKRQWVINANETDLVSYDSTFFGAWDWYSTTQGSAYNASTFAEYFPYNKNNDYTFTNTYWYPVYVFIVFAWNATSTAIAPSDITVTYTYSTPTP